jgi:hypothetical protein
MNLSSIYTNVTNIVAGNISLRVQNETYRKYRENIGNINLELKDSENIRQIGNLKNSREIEDIFYDFVASGNIPTRGHGVRHVGIFVGTKLHLLFSENTLGMRLGPHGLVDGIFGLVLGFHSHKEELNILINY